MADDSFFVPLGGGRFRATAATAGPWGPQFQHGGPAAALLGRAIVEAAAKPGFHVPRLSFELLGPVPVDEVSVEAAVVRPGRNVALIDATLAAGGRPVMLARAWVTIPAPEEGRGAVRSPGDPVSQAPADDAEVPPAAGWHDAHLEGYMRAVDWIHTSGSFGDLGPGGAWVRPTAALVAGTATSPMEQALIVADSGSGVGLSHDLREVQAINVDLTVFFDRLPDGRWIHLDSHTTGVPGGGSFSSSVLTDRHGPFARGVQSLCVQRLAQPTP